MKNVIKYKVQNYKKNMWIVCCIIFVVISVLCICNNIGITSFLTSDAPEFSDYIVSKKHTDLYSGNEELYMSEFFDYLDSADIIAKVKYGGERELAYQSCISKVNVIDVIKGDKDIIGTNIAMFEYNFFTVYNGIKLYENILPYNLMIPNEEYYVFVMDKGRKIRNSFYLDEYTPPDGGIFPFIFPVNVNINDVYVIEESKDKVFYNDVKKFKFVVNSYECLQQVSDIMLKIVNRYQLP